MHFCTVVLIKPEADDIEAGVDELLAPYDENLEVEEMVHGRRCRAWIDGVTDVALSRLGNTGNTADLFYNTLCNTQGSDLKHRPRET